MIKNLCHGGEWHLLKRIKNEQDGQNDHSAKRIENDRKMEGTIQPNNSI